MAENRASFTIRGIESESEAREIEGALGDLEGVMATEIDPESGDADVRFDYDLLAEARIERAVREMGYEVD